MGLEMPRWDDAPMILLGSFLHHEELADILGRALEDRMRPGDATRLKVIVNLNSHIERVYSTWFAQRLFRHIAGAGVTNRPIRTKGELKDLLVEHPWYTNDRINELIGRYHDYPEDYYRETPYEGRVFTAGDPPRYVGSRRVKRIRRISEKCGRRIIDYMLEQIRRRADELASERANRLGIPRDQLVTPPEEMVEEFKHAERRILKSIRDGLFVAAMPQFYIDDIVGIRVLVNEQTNRSFEAWLSAATDLTVVDEKHFSGNFTGRNMVVAWKLPREELLAVPPDDAACATMIERNVAPDAATIRQQYRDLILTDSGHVRFEILTINYEQVIEAEIGRSMHEEHVRAQRDRKEYTGRLAQNVESLMVYLFAFAQSSLADLPSLPIKLRGSYLDDYVIGALRDLWAPGAPSGGLTF
jgi:hypothetical protein